MVILSQARARKGIAQSEPLQRRREELRRGEHIRLHRSHQPTRRLAELSCDPAAPRSRKIETILSTSFGSHIVPCEKDRLTAKPPIILMMIMMMKVPGNEPFEAKKHATTTYYLKFCASGEDSPAGPGGEQQRTTLLCRHSILRYVKSRHTHTHFRQCSIRERLLYIRR